MDACCTTDAAATAACPRCGTGGRSVEQRTVRALLAVSLRHLLPDAEYRFCATADCPVVYFAGTHCFERDALRVPVFQKDSGSAVPVCYCFAHTRGTVRDAQEAGSADRVVADVTTGIQAGQCACETRNPQGSCCLGNVRALVAALEQVETM